MPAVSQVERESTVLPDQAPPSEANRTALPEHAVPAERTSIISDVPPPGLYIADEPLERRPPQASLVTVPRGELSRLRGGMLVLGGLLLMAAGALVVLIFRRAEGSSNRQTARAAASSVRASTPPSCVVLAPPSRISAIERSVPVTARVGSDGTVALGFAETKTSAVTYLYRPLSGDAEPHLRDAGAAELTQVAAGEPLVAMRTSADFAFGQRLEVGLELGVGPTGILRRGTDGATGAVWPLPSGARVTQPRVVALPSAYFVTFRQGGVEGRIMSGWLNRDGTARSELSALAGLPSNIGTPTVALLGEDALLLVSARADKSDRYRLFAAPVTVGSAPRPPRVLEVAGEGGGVIAPSLSPLSSGRYLLQYTDGTVGRYQVHASILNAQLAPVSPPLRLSAKGANAGQGASVGTAQGAASFFIQTTAGHDELWGMALSCP